MPGSSLCAAPWPLPRVCGSGQLWRQVPRPTAGNPHTEAQAAAVSDHEVLASVVFYSQGPARSAPRSAARAQRLRHAGAGESACNGGELAPTVVLHLRVADREPRVRPEQGLQASTAVTRRARARSSSARARTLTSGAPSITREPASLPGPGPQSLPSSARLAIWCEVLKAGVNVVTVQGTCT